MDTDKYVRCGLFCFFFFQAEDGIRDLVRSRGLGDVYKRQVQERREAKEGRARNPVAHPARRVHQQGERQHQHRIKEAHAAVCLLYTSDAADERSSVDLGGRRIIKKKKREDQDGQSGTKQ